MDDNDNIPLVIDNGSYLWRCGFAGDEAPRVLTYSVVGRPSGNVTYCQYRKERTSPWVGDKALENRGFLTLESPIEDGIIVDWGDMELLWRYTFDEQMGVDLQKHPILLTESSVNSKISKEEITNIMFETFNVPALSLASQSGLSLYAAGRSSGLVVDSGHGVTHIVPFSMGQAVTDAIVTVNVGGRHVTDYLMEMLNNKGHSFTTSADREMVRDMKEKMAYVALDFEEEMKINPSGLSRSYQLSDGTVISLDKERFKCTEILFQPSLVDEEGPGIHQAIHESIMKCDPDMHEDLYCNILIAGGNTLFSGITERIYKDIKSSAPPDTKMKIITPPERKYAAWFGGSMLASMNFYPDFWITKEAYLEGGSAIVHKKNRYFC